MAHYANLADPASLTADFERMVKNPHGIRPQPRAPG
jgi:hypothetical protein